MMNATDTVVNTSSTPRTFLFSCALVSVARPTSPAPHLAGVASRRRALMLGTTCYTGRQRSSFTFFLVKLGHLTCLTHHELSSGSQPLPRRAVRARSTLKAFAWRVREADWNGMPVPQTSHRFARARAHHPTEPMALRLASQKPLLIPTRPLSAPPRMSSSILNPLLLFVPMC